MTNGALRILCPRCQWFILTVMKCTGQELELEANCPKDKCFTTVRVVVKEGRIAMEATPRQRKA
jgi:hypothetical protein